MSKLTLLDFFEPRRSVLDQTLGEVCPPPPDKSHITQAFTLTFAPKWHKFDNKLLHKFARNSIRQLFAFCKRTYYIELYSELTANNVLHYHILQIGTKTNCAKLTSFWRKTYGHTYPSKLKCIDDWRDYCQAKGKFHSKKGADKSNLYPVWKFLSAKPTPRSANPKD